ncbi:hypothetical protein FACS18949_18020 [Clostridia bacterium]|nr:hypothetical protein FACS18949_18020 [Clostridia bacterium]
MAKNVAERVTYLPLTDLYPPEFHPFQVNDDQSMTRLANSVARYGVREPGLARSRTDGGYELLCGNRRKRACEIAGLTTMPVVIREMDYDDAVIAMVDSNLETRERILPSEKAWAYRVKLEALNHRGVQSDTPGQLSVDVLVEQTSESKNQIFRLIRLTELIVTLTDKVDAKLLSFNPAVELSYLSQKEQSLVAAAMERLEVKPSLSQAQRLKKRRRMEG